MTLYTVLFIFRGICENVWNFATQEEAENKAREIVNSRAYGNDEDCDVFIFSSKMNCPSRNSRRITKENNNE